MLAKTVFSGFGGQGVLMMGYMLSLSAMNEDRYVTYLPAYGAEMRGGTANCTVVVSSEEIASPIASSPEYAVIMNYPSMLKYQNSIKKGGVMFLNSDLIEERPSRKDIEVVEVPCNTLAHELGSDRSLNMVMLGALAKKTGIVALETMQAAVEEILKGKKQAIIDLNKSALARGAQYLVEGK